MSTKRQRRPRPSSSSAANVGSPRLWALLPECHTPDVEALDLFLPSRDARPRTSKVDVGNGKDVLAIDVFGFLTQRQSMLAQYTETTSLEDVGKVLDDAMRSDAIGGIVLHIDSPGGDVYGVAELAAKIFAYRGRKPLIASIDSLAASGAYWLAAAAADVFMTSGGAAGAIGVLSVHTDTSAKDAKAGVRKVIIREPATKAEGIAGEPLSEDAKRHLEKEIRDRYASFVAAVARYRKTTADQVMNRFGRGRVVLAQDARSAGMIDDVLTHEQVIRYAMNLVRSAK